MKFVINGEPVAQGRPRLSTINGRARAFDPPKSKEWKQRAKELFWIQMKRNNYSVIDKACIVSIKIYKTIPESYTKGKQLLCASNKIRPTTKPDLDNYIKCVMDAMGGVVWHDDNLVVGFFDCGKYYTIDNPRVEVIVEEF